jgi:hypothetical protein
MLEHIEGDVLQRMKFGIIEVEISGGNLDLF